MACTPLASALRGQGCEIPVLRDIRLFYDPFKGNYSNMTLKNLGNCFIFTHVYVQGTDA